MTSTNRKNWAATKAERAQRMATINGRDWIARGQAGAWLVSPYESDEITIGAGVDGEGWALGGPVVTVAVPDAKLEGFHVAALVSEATAMEAILSRLATTMDGTPIGDDAAAVLDRISTKAFNLSQLATADANLRKLETGR